MDCQPTPEWPARPPRLRWVYEAAPLYFVTFCTRGHQALLASDAVHEAFRDGAARVNAIGNAVGRYVIMPDHVHVFIRIGVKGRIGLAVKCLRERITKRLRMSRSMMRVWQPGFFDHVLRSAESYAEKWAYVRQNPVRAGLCDHADEWSYQGETVVIRF